MRTFILSMAAASLLGSGVAFTLQASRHTPQSSAAPEELVEARPAQPAEVAPTPMTFRAVKSVAVVEAKALSPASPQSDPEEHPAATSGVEAPGSAAPTVPAPVEQKTAEADAPGGVKEDATSGRASSKRPHLRQHSAGPVRHSRSKQRVQAAQEKAEPMPPTAMAYDGSNEHHSPFHSLGKVFSGAQ